MWRNKQVDIMATLVLAGGFRFLCCLARACVLPFLTLYFRQRGLSPVMTGIIMAAKHLVTLVWSPLASLLSKHYNKRRLAITVSLVGSALLALLLPLIPPVDVESLAKRCNTTRDAAGLSTVQTPAAGRFTPLSHIAPSTSLARPAAELATTPVLKSITVSPAMTFAGGKPAAVSSSNASHDREEQRPPANEMSPQPASASASVPVHIGLAGTTPSGSVMHHGPPNTSHLVKRKRGLDGSDTSLEERKLGEAAEFLGSLKAMDPQHQLFFLLLICMLVWELLSAPLDWTVDDGLYEYLDSVDASDRYGNTAGWGSLGAACGVGGAGLLVSQLGCFIGGHLTRDAMHFFCYSGLAAPALLAAAFLPLHLNGKRNRAGGLLRALRLVQAHPRALLCATTTLLVGAAGSAVDNFLLWEMEDVGSSELHMGVSLALGCCSQAAFPLLAGRLAFKPLIQGRLLLVGAIGVALQCLYYSFLWGPWAALPGQLLSCFGGGALCRAVQVQCEDVAMPGDERAVGRIHRWLAPGLGASLGSLGGGFVVQWFGVGWLLRAVAGGVAVWCVCLPLLQWKTPHQRRINYSRLLAADGSEASDSGSEQERDWLDAALEDDKRRKD